MLFCVLCYARLGYAGLCYAKLACAILVWSGLCWAGQWSVFCAGLGSTVLLCCAVLFLVSAMCSVVSAMCSVMGWVVCSVLASAQRCVFIFLLVPI